MSKSNTHLSPFRNLKNDIPASIVVFLVALPLCLGIALASGAPLYAGLISGIIGGIIVGSLSASPLGVSGPAAGLAVIVLNAITDLGGFEIFLVAVILGGILQLIMGILRAGIIAYYFPSSVIHGMLAGIGILIFFKQIPHAFGYDKDPEGDFEFFQSDMQNTFSEMWKMIDFISPGVVIITIVSLIILISWQVKLIQRNKIAALIPAPLLAVTVGIILNLLFKGNSTFQISSDHLVTLPVAKNANDFFNNFTLPDFSALANPKVYITAIMIAVVASLETLLCVEASDKQDELKRVTPTNRELRAQGIGNILSGFIGGLPITQVIVRSSANQQAGGRTKASAIIHGVLILASIIAIPSILNLIPYGTLAAILFVVGFKLAKPALFKKMYKQGAGQFIPFLVTVIGILFTDLLIGIALGLVVAIFIILRNNFKVPYEINKSNSSGQEKIRIVLSQDVTFLNKASIMKTLSEISNNSTVEIDASGTQFIHQDVVEIIEDFKVNAKVRNIELTVVELYKGKSAEPIQHFEILEHKN
ncbi:MAG: SulP family inorganic anion transporter [Crocinitomicaceae bacterium]|nr:SulP family inorganic anion transporter [Crocinitomicaceae bacterium]